VRGFYSKLTGFLDHVNAEGFLRPGVREMLLIAENPHDVVAAMRAFSTSAG
jgi:predicted Rossmann-fold nucleotide-binding protein